jgi:hypothetical protein
MLADENSSKVTLDEQDAKTSIPFFSVSDAPKPASRAY